MRNVINQHQVDCPTVFPIDINPCPMLPLDKEITQVPSRRGKETEWEEGEREGRNNVNPYLSHQQ